MGLNNVFTGLLGNLMQTKYENHHLIVLKANGIREDSDKSHDPLELRVAKQ
jgi:hypothetical protein